MKHLHRSHTSMLLAGLLALTACAKNEAAAPKDDVVVATVNGQTIGQTEFNSFVTMATGNTVDKLNPEQKQQVLNRLVGLHLAAQAAEKADLQSQPETATSLYIWRTNVLSDAQLKKYMNEHPISEAELKKEYDTQVAAIPKQYRARHILVESKTIADSLIRELKRGADFAKLAKEESKDTGSASKGGDLDWFTAETMVKPFSEAVARLEKGKITEEPVQSQYGWHVIKLEDVRTQTPAAFADVKQQITQVIQNKKIDAYLGELRKAAKIEIKEDVLQKSAAAPAAGAAK